MYYIPNIIRETSEGLNQIPIQDILFQRREVECIGEITEDSVAALILQLRYLHHEAPEQEITMYINSPGGEVSSGLALYDVMKAIQCPIRTVCVGTAASMAAILFLSGDKRDMLYPKLGEKARNNGHVVYSLDFEVTPHQLRHTYITNLIHASVDPKTVQYLAGHESSKITMDIYAKVKYNRPDDLVKTMGCAFDLWDAV